MRTRTIAFALVISAAAASLLTAGNRMSYIYKRGSMQTSRISGGIALERIGAISRQYGNEFVWVHLDDRRKYVIRDTATLAEVRHIFREVDALHPQLREIEERFRPLEHELEEIERRLDYASDRLSDEEDLSDSVRRDLDEQVRQAELDMRELEVRMKPIEREQERLEKQSDRLEKIAEREFEKLIERAIENGTAQRID